VIAEDGDRDGTPNVILESFACGTPVIASRLPGIEEAVENEASGLLITPGDSTNLGKAICRLIENPQLAEKLVLGGRKILEKRFDAMANNKRLSELFREAIRQS
jgi:glycosyltransferase involved in cell wall biosynthesis